MKVTGLSGVTEISEVNIAYFYVRGDTVRIHYTDNSFYGLICRSQYHAMITAHAFWKSNYRNFITVCGTDGVSYYIKISSIDSTLINGTTLYITVSGMQLVVPCKDLETAQWDKDYVDTMLEGRTFLDTFGGTVLEVGPGKTYATIALAMTAAISGQAVRVYPATYTENIVPKNGVILYMEEGAKNIGYMTLPETVYTFKIFGYGDFENPTGGVLVGESLPGTVQSKLIWQFGTIKAVGTYPVYPKECRSKIIMKGGLGYNPDSVSAAFVDTDNGCNIDIDMVNVSHSECLTYIAFNTRTSGRCKVRNVEFIESANVGVINASSHFFALLPERNYGYELVNVQFANTQDHNNDVGFAWSDGFDAELPYGFCRVYNCIFVSNGAYNSPNALRSQYSGFRFELFGKNFLGGNVVPGYVGETPNIQPSLGYFTQVSSENINGVIMPLTSKPKKSKFQVGETVWYFINGQLVSGVVKKTKTIMTNVADTADGEQNNLYAIGSADATMTPESQVFRTRNMALWKMANSSTRLNTILFNNIDASIDFNPDLSALDLSGCDMSTGVPDWTLVRLDGAKLDATTQLPASVDTLEEMKALIKSYDPVDSIWKNGSAFGE
jgi:hypothetical protein